MDIKSMFAGIEKPWRKLLTGGELGPLIVDVIKKLGAEKKRLKLKSPETSFSITPPEETMFNFARFTPYEKVRIIIIGQDPYYLPNQAHGIAFSTELSKTPSSLNSIFKCLNREGFIKYNGEFKENKKKNDLRSWANQGVLLLNTSFTTTIGKANAHRGIWKKYTDALIKKISTSESLGDGSMKVFMLWGNDAQSKIPLIHEDCIIYKWIHPSPLAQIKAPEEKKFINCDNFREVNELLESEYQPAIYWDPIVNHVIYTDGACSGNGKGIFAKAGWAYYFEKGPFAGKVYYGKVPIAFFGSNTIYGTNQRGEGLAIFHAINHVLDSGITGDVTIITDSMFWKNMIEKWMPGWEQKGIDFSERKNPDITIPLVKLVKSLKQHSTLKLIHVNSHGKDPNADPAHVRGNNIADKYAVMGKDVSGDTKFEVML